MNRIIRKLKHIFIPHEHNDYKPHFFREISVASITMFAVLLLAVSVGSNIYIKNTGMTASVLPSVLVDLTNSARASNGGSTLARSTLLEKAAQLKAQDMARLSYFAHTSPQGLTPWHWFREVGYSFIYAGENLAIDFSESVDVENAWMNSPTHKANLLNDNFTEIGIATAEGIYQGHPTTYVVQMFGSPILSIEKNKKDKALEENTKNNIQEVKNSSLATNKTITTPSVKGEETNVLESTLQTIADTNQFIAVKDTKVEKEVGLQVPDSQVSKEEPVYYSSWYDRLLFMMPSHINKIYKVIMLIVLISLMLMSVIEIKRQHPKNIIYGILLLVIMGSLMYLNKSIFISSFFT